MYHNMICLNWQNDRKLDNQESKTDKDGCMRIASEMGGQSANECMSEKIKENESTE